MLYNMSIWVQQRWFIELILTLSSDAVSMFNNETSITFFLLRLNGTICQSLLLHTIAKYDHQRNGVLEVAYLVVSPDHWAIHTEKHWAKNLQKTFQMGYCNK